MIFGLTCRQNVILSEIRRRGGVRKGDLTKYFRTGYYTFKYETLKKEIEILTSKGFIEYSKGAWRVL